MPNTSKAGDSITKEHKMKPQHNTERIPLLNPAQKILYFIYAVCLIVAGLDIWVWRP